MVTHYLRQYRERAGLTQDVLAEKAGTFASVISRFESGGRAISLEMAVRLCRALDIKLGQLLEPPGAASRPSLDSLAKDVKPEKLAEFASVVESIAKAFRSE